MYDDYCRRYCYCYCYYYYYYYYYYYNMCKFNYFSLILFYLKLVHRIL
ncbi:MAG: hypothetical protein K7J15_05445 [Candidatus Regiella insecticola]|nr:hypothetical protein [Candidatus Regiella insecticola]